VVEERPEEPRGAKATSAQQKRLAAIRCQIDAGKYETPEKLEKALHRMLADLRGLATPHAATREDENGGGPP